MNIKEAIAEIEKRYKVGDKIPCLENSETLNYKGIESILEVDVYDEVWVGNRRKNIVIYTDGKWSEPIREEKNLWNFFKSIDGEYPDVVEKYLRNLDIKFLKEYVHSDSCLSLIDIGFKWQITKEGNDYWWDINKLYNDYLEN